MDNVRTYFYFSSIVLISFMTMLPRTMFSVLTVSFTSGSMARLTSTRVEADTVCPANRSKLASPLGTW